MASLMDACYDLLALRMGRRPSWDGKWKWNSTVDHHPVEVYLMVDDEERVALHVESPRCPVKFLCIESLEQIRAALDYVLAQPL
jgi:hypothetical protein